MSPLKCILSFVVLVTVTVHVTTRHDTGLFSAFNNAIIIMRDYVELNNSYDTCSVPYVRLVRVYYKLEYEWEFNFDRLT